MRPAQERNEWADPLRRRCRYKKPREKTSACALRRLASSSSPLVRIFFYGVAAAWLPDAGAPLALLSSDRLLFGRHGRRWLKIGQRLGAKSLPRRVRQGAANDVARAGQDELHRLIRLEPQAAIEIPVLDGLGPRRQIREQHVALQRERERRRGLSVARAARLRSRAASPSAHAA